MFLKLVSLPAACAGTGLVAPSSLVAPCAFIVSVKTAALVLAVNSSAAGQYWKQTDAGTPWILRNVVIKEGNYTKWGLVFQMAEQTCWTALWLSYFDPDHASLYGGVICALGPVGLCNIWTNAPKMGGASAVTMQCAARSRRTGPKHADTCIVRTRGPCTGSKVRG
jgi:hypothetical protein